MPIHERPERIAIVGVGGIFPGAPDLDTFWQNIAAGIDSGRHVPPDRWALSPQKAFDADGPKPDRVYSTWGCYIDDFRVDPSDLNIDRGLLNRLDPLFHLGLHAARAAIVDAGQLASTDRNRVGVILGNIALPTESTSAICRDVLGRTFVEQLIHQVAESDDHRRYLESKIGFARSVGLSPRSSPEWDPVNRFAASLPAGLIAQALNLGGSAYTLDAACASSLYALKFACEELRAHRADAMLAGGMSRPDCQYTQMGFGQLKALSRQGRCAPLSSAADGLVVGEGAGVFILKRLSDAMANNDQIYGVIAGIGLSNDRGANLLAPHSEGQLRAMRAAYDEAHWRPSDVDLIECHATGTPVGDSVEIASLHQLWQDEQYKPRQCVIGGVKSNVGHLLTGAGAAGLMKVLLALKHQTLPPTANFRSPASGLDAANTPFRVLSHAEPWPARKDPQSSESVPRRATVNAFGFGGINAHVLIEEFSDAIRAEQVARPETPFSLATSFNRHSDSADDIAIVGFAIHVGSQGPSNNSSDSVETSTDRTAAQNDWGVLKSDWYRREFPDQVPGVSDVKFDAITEIELPLGAFRIPPLEMQDMLPQQQLMLDVSAAALRNADRGRSIQKPSATMSMTAAHFELGNRTGVFVGIELDPNTSNFHLRWSIEQEASQWANDLGLQLSDGERTRWIGELKDSISPPLTANRVMGNLGGIVASRLAREFDVGGPSFTISSDENSGLRACELAVNALRRGELDQALVGAVDLPCDIRARVSLLRSGSESSEPKITDGATAIVLKRLEDAQRDGDAIHAVIRTLTSDESVGTAAAIRPEINVGAATGLVSLVEAVRSLSQNIQRDPDPEYWLRNRSEGPRRAIVPGCGVDGRGLVFELAEKSPQSDRNVRKGSSSPTIDSPCLFVIDGDSLDELSVELRRLQALVASAKSLVGLARHWFRQGPAVKNRAWTMAFVVHNLAELPELIARGISHLDSGIPTDEPDRRIRFSRRPVGKTGRLAFVFPGSGNAFVGMGREILAAFPDVLDQQDIENLHLKDQYRPDLIWHADSTTTLLNDHKSMIFGQVALGTAVCDLLSQFGVRPTASIGYSLGESAALFGLRAWTDRDEMLQRMHDATLFGSDLVRPFNAARKARNVPDTQEVDWISGVIDRSAAVVRTAIFDTRPAETPSHDSARSRESRHADLKRYPHVYLLIVNTPNQCVIGGWRDEVEQLVRDLGAQFVPLAAPSTVHCEILRQVEPAYRALHLMPTTQPHSIDFYSTAWGRSYSLSRETAAEAIVAQAVDTVDFPRVIEQVYADGVRVFVEIGPGSSCCRMIDETLEGRPHVVQSAMPVTGKPLTAFFELLAMLVAEGVPVDLSYLYGGLPDNDQQPKSSKGRIVTRTSGPPFTIPTPSNGWATPPVHFPQEEPPTEPFETATNLFEPPIHPSSFILHPSPPSGSLVQETFESGVLTQLEQMVSARANAHETYLRVAATAQSLIAEQIEHLGQISTSTTLVMQPPELLCDHCEDQYHLETVAAPSGDQLIKPSSVQVESTEFVMRDQPPRSLSRDECMEFAIGRIGRVLGKPFAEIDTHPTRVRLPDEPLMLVDRILEIEGEPLSMTSGRVVTEHDIHSGSWYLDGGRIPTCIAVEAGQADLFLSGWLGIDLQTKGLACYRLLDAVVTFHDHLPQPGQVIHYNIRINHFFRQGQTYLFRFEFDATVDGKPLLTMREGCAGFFTEAELASGKGIVHTALDKQPRPGKRPNDWINLVPMSVESFSDEQILSLRRGQLEACFGSLFANLAIDRPETLPGLNQASQVPNDSGSRSRMWLIDRVLKLDPAGGKFGIGMILGELDIHPDDWFLTCHFCDDQVMPGTLMYECCLHTLRIYLLRMGWIGEHGQVVHEPVPGVRSRLKCRGQVRANTKKVWYEITLKEIGYGAPGSESSTDNSDSMPYCLADALMYADGKPIVEITDMSVRLTGLTRQSLELLWKNQSPATTKANSARPEIRYDRQPAIFDTDRITAFAIGKPSDAFGDRYRVFDADRVIARLPGPPFQFLDRIVRIEDCEPWVLRAGGKIVAQYEIPPDAWYFAANRQRRMPFSVLLETALQPCGWLAAYCGSALTSETDVSFRNLGGSATQYKDVTPYSGTLTTTVKMTRVSNSGGMIIQHYDFDLRCDGEPIYVGDTYFGFFSKASLANQIGIRDAKPFMPSPTDLVHATKFSYTDAPPFANAGFRMIDDVQLSRNGGPAGQGFAVGTMSVDPSAWFFKAHFYQDPVVPGSLGLESFFQLLKFYAAARWSLDSTAEFVTPIVQPRNAAFKPKHEWVYRGQVIPADKLVTVSAVISKVDDTTKELTADGFLSVDGRVIYQMKNFSLGVS